MPDDEPVSLAVRAVYDHGDQAVGLEAVASEAFDRGEDPKAQVEVLAAIAAKANALASDVIQRYDPDPGRRQELYEHFASLKEHMLNDMLEQDDRESDSPST